MVKSTELRIRQTKDYDTIKKLNNSIFPGEDYDFHHKGIYWLAFANDLPIGFCGLHTLSLEPDKVFYSRAGVSKIMRGYGIHKKLIYVRNKWCRANNITAAVTYTLQENDVSANNLIQCGFQIYVPDYAWAGREFIYFMQKF